MKFFSVALLGTVFWAVHSVAFAAEPAEEIPGAVLCQGNYQTEDEAVRQLERLAATWTTQKDWQARAQQIRQQILVGAKLDPLPERTPLNAIVRNRRAFNGYSVESAAFEARPGFFVYGNLYRPIESGGKAPGILCRMAMLADATEGDFEPISRTVAPRWLGWEQSCFLTTWSATAIPNISGGITSMNRL